MASTILVLPQPFGPVSAAWISLRVRRGPAATVKFLGFDLARDTFCWRFGEGAWRDEASFAALHFGIAPRRVAVMDPQHRLMLEAVRDFAESTGRVVGVKVAGGIRSAKDAGTLVEVLTQSTAIYARRQMANDLLACAHVPVVWLTACSSIPDAGTHPRLSWASFWPGRIAGPH